MVRGRKREVSRAVLSLTGGAKRGREDIPVQPGEIPMPELTEAGKRAWPLAMAAITEAGLSAPRFATAAMLLSESLGEWLAISKECETVPRLKETERGSAIHPIHKLKAQAFERLTRTCKEFGMTPASLGGIKLAVREPEKKAGIASKKDILQWRTTSEGGATA